MSVHLGRKNNMNVEAKKVGKWNALVFTDEDNGDVCITLQESGGAIIGAENYSDAENKFIEAMNLADSIRKLIYFKAYGKFPN